MLNTTLAPEPASPMPRIRTLLGESWPAHLDSWRAVSQSSVAAAGQQLGGEWRANRREHVNLRSGQGCHDPADFGPRALLRRNRPGSFGQAQGGGIVRAADQYGFIMVVPSSGRCWDVVSNRTRTRDGGGDSNAIRQMVTYALDTHQRTPIVSMTTGDSSGMSYDGTVAASTRMSSKRAPRSRACGWMPRCQRIWQQRRVQRRVRRRVQRHTPRWNGETIARMMQPG